MVNKNKALRNQNRKAKSLYEKYQTCKLYLIFDLRRKAGIAPHSSSEEF